MVNYKSVLTNFNLDHLAVVMIEALIKYHGLPDSIITDQRLLFIFTT